DRGVDVVLQVPVLWVRDIADAEQFLDFFPPVVGRGNGFVFFVDNIIAGELLRFARRGVNLFASLQLGNNAIDALVLIGRLFTGPADNERSPRFVNEDRVNLVDNRVVVRALDAILQVKLHVVAKVVEP